MTLGLNVITEFVAGLIMPGDPIANVTFKTYAYITQNQALFFLSDLKLGHYMKVRSMGHDTKNNQPGPLLLSSFRFLLVSCSPHRSLPLLLLVLSICGLLPIS